MKIKRIVLVLFAFCFAFLLYKTETVQASKSNPNMKIYCIYLGDNSGDSILVESDGKYLLMDLGPKESYSYVKNFLKKMNVTKLDLYLSHLHADHTGGLRDGEGYEQLMKDFQVGRVYLPNKSLGKLVDHKWNYDKLEEIYLRYHPTANINGSFTYLNVGSKFSVGDVSAEVIGPVGMDNVSLSQFSHRNKYENNSSLVTRMTCGKTTYLTGGDTEEYQEKQLVKKYGKKLKADIYKLSHHGYAGANSIDFMKHVAPTYSFAPSSGLTGFTTEDTTNHRITYTARYNTSQHGFVYMVGDEKKTFMVGVSNDKVNLYTESSFTKSINSGWVKTVGADGKNEKYDYYYFGSNGKPLTGIQKINGKMYYLGPGGCREIGVFTSGKYNSWRKYDITKNTYGMRYFDRSTGEMKAGWLKIKNQTFYLDKKTGFRVSGLKKIDGKTYYFGNAGTLFTNRFIDISGKRRYFDSKGVMKTGFLKLKGKLYYFDKNGIMAKGSNKWPIKKINGKYYAISGTGIISNTGWRVYTEKGKKNHRYFDTKGVMKTGWYKEKGKSYYLDNNTGFKSIGLKKVGTKYYFFKNDGTMAKNHTATLDGYKLKFNGRGVLTNVPKIQTTKLKTAKAGKKNAGLTWNKNSKVDGYEVFYSKTSKGTYKRAALLKTNNTTKYTIKKLKTNTTYFVKIRSYKKIGGQYFYSNYSNIKNINVK